MTSQTTLTKTLPRWISDPSHAWLVVELTDYPDALEASTGYGYMQGNTIYLEEDIEAVAFFDLHPEIDARTLPERHYERDAPCRNLSSNVAVLDVEAFYARRQAENAAS